MGDRSAFAAESGACRGGGARAQLRAWLEYVAEVAIDWLDQLDSETEDLEDEDGGAGHG